MGTRLLKWTASAAALALIAAGAAGEARASGFQLFDQSPSGQGDAFAGAAAAAEDASTIFYNPAGMTYLKDYQAIGGLQIIAPTIVSHPHVATTNPSAVARASGVAPANLTGDATRDGGETAVVPNLYMMAPIRDDFRVGLGIEAPFGLVTDYGSNQWVGRYYAERSQITTYNFNPSAAWRASDWLSLGIGFDVMHGHALLKNAVDFGSACTNSAGAATCGAFGLSPQANDGQADLEGSDTSIGWNGGVIVKPLENTRIGLSYHSPVTLHLTGEATFAVPAAYRALQAGVPAFAGNFVNTGAQSDITLPEYVTAAVYQQVTPKWALLGDVTWTRWSRFQRLVVSFDNPLQPQQVTEEDWHNTFRTALGAVYTPNEKSKLRMGIAYDPTPTRTATRTLRIPDSDRFWLSIGYNLALLENLSLDAAYTHIFALTNGEVNQSSTSAGNIAGNFDNSVNIFALGLKYSF